LASNLPSVRIDKLKLKVPVCPGLTWSRKWALVKPWRPQPALSVIIPSPRMRRRLHWHCLMGS